MQKIGLTPPNHKDYLQSFNLSLKNLRPNLIWNADDADASNADNHRI